MGYLVKGQTIGLPSPRELPRGGTGSLSPGTTQSHKQQGKASPWDEALRIPPDITHPHGIYLCCPLPRTSSEADV